MRLDSILEGKDQREDGDYWLTSAEVARFFNVAAATVRAWANKGEIQAQQTSGGHRRFLLSEVQRLASDKSYGVSAARGSISPPKILIVDDDAGIAGVLIGLLRQHLKDVEVLHASDGFEASAMTQEFTPDIVFLDIMMPGILGDAVCRFLRRKPHLKHVPIIGITGYAGPEKLSLMKAAGALMVLEKPFNRAELLKCVDQLLEVKGVWLEAK